MSRADTFKAIRKGLTDYKNKGNEVVDLTALLKYLDGLEAEMGESEEMNLAKEVKLEQLRAQFANQQLHFGWQKDSSLEMFKSVIASGQNSLRACMLINAGACIALLAFIGNLASSADTRLFIPQFAGVMLCFVIGVLVVSIAYGATYWTQHCYHHNEEGKWGIRWQMISTVLAILSYLLFLIGSFQGYRAMTAMYVEPAPDVALQLSDDVHQDAALEATIAKQEIHLDTIKVKNEVVKTTGGAEHE